MTTRYVVKLFGTSHGGICNECQTNRWSVIVQDDKFVDDKGRVERPCSLLVLCDVCAAKLAVALLEATSR